MYLHGVVLGGTADGTADEPLTGRGVGVNNLACKGERCCVSGRPKAGYYRRPLAMFGHPQETLERGGYRNERVVGSPFANKRRGGSGAHVA